MEHWIVQLLGKSHATRERVASRLYDLSHDAHMRMVTTMMDDRAASDRYRYRAQSARRIADAIDTE